MYCKYGEINNGRLTFVNNSIEQINVRYMFLESINLSLDIRFAAK